MTSAPYEIIIFVGFMVVVVEARVPTEVGRNADCESLQVYHSQVQNRLAHGESEHWIVQSPTILCM